MDVQNSRPMYWWIFLVFSLYIAYQMLSTEKKDTPIFFPSEEIPNVSQAINSWSKIDTPSYEAWINLNSGDIEKFYLKKYYNSLEDKEPYLLLKPSTSKDKYFLKSGTLIEDFSGKIYPINAKSWNIKRKENIEDGIIFTLNTNVDGLDLEKEYFFSFKKEYEIDFNFSIKTEKNDPIRVFLEIQQSQPKKEGSFLIGQSTYFGGAASFSENPYKKITYEEIKDNKFSSEKFKSPRWISMQDRYFVTAWAIDEQSEGMLFGKYDSDKKVHRYGILSENLRKNGEPKTNYHAKIYLGPEDVDQLRTFAPHFDLTVDYGFFWPVSQGALWVLKKINTFTQNLGYSIILATILMKLLLAYPQYKTTLSQRKIKMLQPEVLRLKKICADDPMKLRREMNKLYKKNGISMFQMFIQLGINIPIMLGVYWMLVESLELRHSFFIGPYEDLAMPDPYYLFPFIAAASFWLMQKAMPQPENSFMKEASTFMKILPVFMFLFMMGVPAGLSLYWAVGNFFTLIQNILFNKIAESEKRLC